MATITIREIRPEDAESYNTYRKRIADEPDNMVGHSAGDYTRTVEQEHERISQIIEDPYQHMLVAVVNEAVIGGCFCKGFDRPSIRHNVGLGIDVAPEYRGQGIGKQLMENAIAWAQMHPTVSRIELDVFTVNYRAIGLYLKYGFKIEGCKINAYINYGRYVDTYLMALILDKQILPAAAAQQTEAERRVIHQGDIYWVQLENTPGEEDRIPHPHVIIQDNVLNHSRIETVVACALTTNLHKTNIPGNVLLETGEANLPRQSLVEVSKITTLQKSQLRQYIGTLSEQRIMQILAGLRFLQRSFQ